MTAPGPALRRLGGRDGDREAELLALLERHAFAANTRDAYDRDWRAWAAHLASRGLASPALAEERGHTDMLARLWVLEMHDAGLSAATIRRRLAGVRHGYRRRGWPWDGAQASETARAAARQGATRQRQARPITLAMLRRMARACGRSVRGRRDRALLLLGWHGALRAGELAGLRWRDLELELDPDGIRIHLAQAKGDRAGAGQSVALRALPEERTLCPVRALSQWRAAGGGDRHPLFVAVRGGSLASAALRRGAVTAIVRRRMEIAKLSAAGYSAHSLRSGFVSEAVRHPDCNLVRLRAHTRHRSIETLAGYAREAEALIDHPATWMPVGAL